MTVQANPMLAAALDFQQRGWSVIPLQPGDKKPLEKWKHRQNQPATPDEIERIWSLNPAANVGIVTGAISGIVVLDIDNPDALKHVAGLEDVLRKMKAPVVRTGRPDGRGRHIYLRHPGEDLRNFAQRVPGLDGRADGGYVVAPPSVHASGNSYEWVDGYSLDTPLPALPPMLLDMFDTRKGPPRDHANLAPPLARSNKSSYGDRALQDELQRVRSAEPGCRNETLNKASFNLGQLCAGGQLDRASVEHFLLTAAMDCGLSDQEARATIASGLSGGASNPRTSQAARTSHASPASDFQPLNLEILNGTRRAPPLFPTHLLGPKWTNWIDTTAEACSSPKDYVAGSLLTVTSTLVGNARRVSPWEGWVEPAHIWGMIIGDPSASKTPAMRPVLRLLEPIEDQLVSRHAESMSDFAARKAFAEAAEAQWKEECKSARKNGNAVPSRPPEANIPAEPICPQIVVNDVTQEALGLISSANPKGVLFFRDELAGWLYGFGRYGGDGERQLWLEAYNGDKKRIDRIKHPQPIIIRHFSVGILGGIQPERLSEAIIKEVDDGLGARFLYFWPESVPPQRPRPVISDSFAGLAVRRLFGLEMHEDERGFLHPTVRHLTDDAAARFQQWREHHEPDQKALTGLLLKGHYGKMPGMVLRLSLLLEYLRWAANDRNENSPTGVMDFGDVQNVSLLCIESAIQIVEQYFKPMAQRVFGDADVPEGDRLAAQLARWIVDSRPATFNARQARSTSAGPGIRDPRKLEEACEALRDRGWLRFAGSRADGRPGRQSSDWEVNPLLWSSVQ